ncbi:MAG: GGDEF domain-containing protein [Fodinibius sp.]|nr:GGDEF domain-containing protein [Fodinibius sp.]
MDNGDFLCLGRREYLDTVIWGGDPTKPVINGEPDRPRLVHDPHSSPGTRQCAAGAWPFGAKEKTVAVTLRNLMIEAKALELRRQTEQKLQHEVQTELADRPNQQEELYRHGQEEIERARRYSRALSLVYFDIDHFKTINDTYGHEAGDKVLQRVADLCRQRLRANDVCARLGGEEFVILLPETELQTPFVLLNPCASNSKMTR